MTDKLTCPICGEDARLPEGQTAGFCESCGARLEAAALVPTSAPEPRRSFLKPLIAAASVVVVAAVAVVVALNLNKGSVSEYQKAETKFFAPLISASETAADKGAKMTLAAAYAPSDFTRSFVDDVSLNLDLGVKGQTFLYDIAATYGKESLNALWSFDGDEMTVAFPGLTDYFLTASMSALNGAADYVQPDYSKLDQTKLKKTIENIAGEYFKLAETRETVEKDVSVAGGGITVSASVHTLGFTERFLRELAIKAVDEILANDNLLEFVKDYQSNANSSYGADFDAVSELGSMKAAAQSELDKLSGEGETVFTMKTWIVKDDIVGRRISYGSDYFAYFSLKNDKSSWFNLDTSVGLTIDGAFAKTGDGWSGTPKITFSYGGETLTFSPVIENFRVDGDFVLGKISLAGTLEEVPYDFALDLGRDGDKQTIGLTGTVFGYDLGKLTLSSSYSETADVTLPSYDKKYAVDVMTIEQNEAFLAELERLREKHAGTLIGQALDYITYSLYDSEYYDEDWSDYDFDDYDY